MSAVTKHIVSKKFFPIYSVIDRGRSQYMTSSMAQEGGFFANSNISRRELIAWLDEQEQKPFSRVSPIHETVQAFDHLYHRHRDGGPIEENIYPNICRALWKTITPFLTSKSF